MKQQGQIEQAELKKAIDNFYDVVGKPIALVNEKEVDEFAEALFTAGAKFALQHQWHDAKIDKPDLSCRILAYLSWDNLEVSGKKSPEVLNVAEKPYKHYYDLGGEEVPISAIKYWMEVPTLEGGEK